MKTPKNISFFCLLIITILTTVAQKVNAATITHDISTASLFILGSSTNDYIITGTTTSYKVVINSGYKGTITLRNVNITSDYSYSPIAVLGQNDCSNLAPVTNVNIVLEGNNSLIFNGNTYAALQVNQGAQINISSIDPANNASGTLIAEATDTYGGGAGIGAINGEVQGSATVICEGYTMTMPTAGGNVIVSSGTIKARGGHGAGIGGGFYTFYNGMIVIYGGIVDASAGFDAAGIGSGCPLGTGIVDCYAPNSAVIVLPPAKITATGAGETPSGGIGITPFPSLGLAGTNSITYIGDPSKPEVIVRTEDYEKNANIYVDLSQSPTIASIITALIPSEKLDINKVKFGSTQGTGIYKFNGILNDNTTFYTDASSSDPATLGRPYRPITIALPAGGEVILPLLETDMSVEPIPSIDMEEGYAETLALTTAYRVIIKYFDPLPMDNVVFSLGNTDSDFSALIFYKDDGVTEITAPTTLNQGDVIYVAIPLKVGKPTSVYADVLRFEGTWDNKSTGFIRQVIDQKVTFNDTEFNKYIKVTASPSTFYSKTLDVSTTLSLSISHTGYTSSDVQAKYFITTEPNYNLAVAATPVLLWHDLNISVGDGIPMATEASFKNEVNCKTYYIHWHVVSGIISAHSKTVVNPAATFGGFGPYTLALPATKDMITANDTAICIRDFAVLKANSVGANPLYKWYVSQDAANPIWTDDTYTTPKLTISGDTTFYVTMSNDKYCENEKNERKEVQVTVYNDLYILPETVPRYKSYETYNVILTSNAVNPLFSLFNGSLINGLILSSLGELSGTVGRTEEASAFTVQVKDVNGCVNTRDYVLFGDIFVPKVFSPNGDGVNDYFMLGYKLVIYDRLGTEIYKGNNGWDGTYKNKPAAKDIYFYKLFYINPNNKEDSTTGYIGLEK